MMAEASTKMITSIIELFFFSGCKSSAGIWAVPARITGIRDEDCAGITPLPVTAAIGSLLRPAGISTRCNVPGTGVGTTDICAETGACIAGTGPVWLLRELAQSAAVLICPVGRDDGGTTC